MPEPPVYCDACLHRHVPGCHYMVRGTLTVVSANLCDEHLAVLKEDHPRWTVLAIVPSRTDAAAHPPNVRPT